MLRAVCLLPTARLTPARGLLTPRSDDRVSPARLGPATRRTGAYRGGTCTRWKRAARRLRPDFLSFACFATHHGFILCPAARDDVAARDGGAVPLSRYLRRRRPRIFDGPVRGARVL